MGLFDRVFGTTPPEPRPAELSPLQQMVHQSATRLMEIINESMQIANTSKIASTRVSRLELARAKLDELKALSLEHPFLVLVRLEQVEADMAQISTELSESGAYAATGPREREYRHDIHRGVNVEAFQSLIKGRAFHATIQLRTPLRVLSRDGEYFAGLGEPPVIARELWEGSWDIELKTWAELGGADIPAFAPTTRASDIGQVPLDGGEYLVLLKKVRELVESDRSVEERREHLIGQLSGADWRPYIGRLSGLERAVSSLFPRFLHTIKGLGAEAIELLCQRGWDSAKVLDALPNAALLDIDGIGPARLKLIRAACASAELPLSRFVDTVIR